MRNFWEMIKSGIKSPLVLELNDTIHCDTTKI